MKDVWKFFAKLKDALAFFQERIEQWVLQRLDFAGWQFLPSESDQFDMYALLSPSAELSFASELTDLGIRWVANPNGPGGQLVVLQRHEGSCQQNACCPHCACLLPRMGVPRLVGTPVAGHRKEIQKLHVGHVSRNARSNRFLH